MSNALLDAIIYKIDSVQEQLEELFEMTGKIAFFCSHYPKECLRNMQIMRVIVDAKNREIGLPEEITRHMLLEASKACTDKVNEEIDPYIEKQRELNE